MSQFYSSAPQPPTLKSQNSTSNLKLLRPTTEYRSAEELRQDMESLRKKEMKSVDMLEEQLKCVKELVSSPKSPKRKPVSPNSMQKL